MKLEPWTEQLSRMVELKEGWDGYKAQPPSERAIEQVGEFLRAVAHDEPNGSRPVPSRVAPSVEGGVGITFRGGSNRKVYVEFFNTGEVYALFSDGRTDPRSVPVSTDHHGFPTLIHQIQEYLDARPTGIHARKGA